MAEERIVGIDLGTTNSLVAFMQGETPVVIPGDDGSNLVPSVVALDVPLNQRVLKLQRNQGVFAFLLGQSVSAG